MPGATSKLHLDMYNIEERPTPIYGTQWGDPLNHKENPGLAMVLNHFITPYVKPETKVLEIGPGGGRWTRFFRHADHVTVVDPFEVMLEETKTVFEGKNLTTIQNSGTDFPGVPERSIDFIFTFDVFVHLDVPIIKQYLINAKKILHDYGVMFVHYGDKTKHEGKENTGYSVNSPKVMNALFKELGLVVIAENTTIFNNSCFALLKKGAGELYCPTGAYPLLSPEDYDLVE
jgi:SAM-dependent methyltransferase